MVKKRNGFWDTSAILPLCQSEPRSSAVAHLWRQYEQKIVWWGSIVELYSALARLEREKIIVAKQRTAAEKRISRISQTWFTVAPIERVRELAQTFPATFELKAADSLQLAAALVAVREKPNKQEFITGDVKLSVAAASAGFSSIKV